MTQEEKARAYDEALEKARKYLEDEGFTEMADIFPELAKSEDEKILASIADCVGLMGEDSDVFSNHNVTKVCVLSWIKKQKECLANNSKTLASDDERIRKFICSIIDNLEPKDFVDVKKMNVLAWLEKQEDLFKCDANWYLDS